MTEPPEWLPDLLSLSNLEPDPLNSLYRIFLEDFRNDACQFDGVPVRWDSKPVPGRSFDNGFWHLVSREDPKTKIRSFDPQRAIRLPWCAALIEHVDSPEVLVWEYRQSGKRERTYCWIEQYDYVVAMEYREGNEFRESAMYIVTAYHLDGRRSRETFRRQYQRGRKRL